MLNRRKFVVGSTSLASLLLAACKQKETQDTTQTTEVPSVDTSAFRELLLDSAQWRYDQENDLYWQLGLNYCKNPASKAHEACAIFVPGPYFKGTKKGDVYEVELNKEASVGGYTAETAPIVLPVNAGRLSAQACPTSYSADGLQSYMEQGFIYVYAGFRGKSAGYESSSKEIIHGGSPWPVVDMKAAVRYIRLNLAAEKIPGSKDRIISFGFGEGAALVATLGASGDSESYNSYLDSIGAATIDTSGNTLSDAIYGAATWCASVGFDEMDMGYEWAQGQWQTDTGRESGSFGEVISKDLAKSYASWVNANALTDSEGTSLTLDATEDGSYAQGSYYDALMSVVEASATNFCQNTAFPYTVQASTGADIQFPGDPNLADTEVVDAASTSAAEKTGAGESTTESDGQTSATPAVSGVSQVQATVYDSLEAYLSTLNKDGRWISYSASKKQAQITGLWNVAEKLRPATKSPLSFDSSEKSSDINQLFGIDDDSTLHFSSSIASLLEANQDSYKGLSGYDESWPSAWADDLSKKDAMDTAQATRVNLMDPLYFLLESNEGFGTSTVASAWRVHEGLQNIETPLVSFANMHFALSSHKSVAHLSSKLVFDAGYGLAEDGGATQGQKNFISWVCEVCPADASLG